MQYLPRNGIVTPNQIISAVQDGMLSFPLHSFPSIPDVKHRAGFNMDNTIARFLAYGTFLVDGNVITNEMSIGSKTPATGPDPPSPAIVGGLDTHAVFEGWNYIPLPHSAP